MAYGDGAGTGVVGVDANSSITDALLELAAGVAVVVVVDMPVGVVARGGNSALLPAALDDNDDDDGARSNSPVVVGAPTDLV